MNANEEEIKEGPPAPKDIEDCCFITAHTPPRRTGNRKGRFAQLACWTFLRTQMLSIIFENFKPKHNRNQTRENAIDNALRCLQHNPFFCR